MVQYINNLKLLLEKYKVHVTEAVKTETASCRPVWNVYRIGRDLVCRQSLDALVSFLLLKKRKLIFYSVLIFRMDFGLYVFSSQCRLLPQYQL